MAVLSMGCTGELIESKSSRMEQEVQQFSMFLPQSNLQRLGLRCRFCSIGKLDPALLRLFLAPDRDLQVCMIDE